MIIRIPTREDVPVILRGMIALFDYHFDLTNDERFKVSIDEEGIVRSLDKLEYYLIGNSFIRGKGPVIMDLWTPVEERGKGQATQLVKHYIQNKTGVSALVDERNQEAVQFWSKTFPEIKLEFHAK